MPVCDCLFRCSAFIFLYENQLFLTFRNRTVAVWNFRGELVTSFEDHLLWHPDCNTNNIYITSDQDLIISYCKADSDDSSLEGNGNFSFAFFGHPYERKWRLVLKATEERVLPTNKPLKNGNYREINKLTIAVVSDFSQRRKPLSTFPSISPLPSVCVSELGR